MKYTHIIWDFNGTILDDVSIGIESVNVLLRKREIKEISGIEEYRKVFGFPIVDYYKRIGFDFNKEAFSDVAVEWVNEYMSRVTMAKTNNGVEEVLRRVKEKGLEQVLISATEINMLKMQLEMLGIAHLFDEVYGLDNIHAQNKTAVALLWKEKYPDAKALFVGDTDHDFETALAIGADCVLYCGGHQLEKTLYLLGCHVIHDFSELDEIVWG